MNVYAIKHKPTGAYMPARMFRASNHGWSYWVPGPAPSGWSGLDGYDKNPRIFFTLQAARNSLTAWLQGPWKRVTGTDGDWETGYFDVDLGPAPTDAQGLPPRVREDMEIVVLELTGL